MLLSVKETDIRVQEISEFQETSTILENKCTNISVGLDNYLPNIYSYIYYIIMCLFTNTII